jgi:hypothetical protein
MYRGLCGFVALALLASPFGAAPGLAQKSVGILRVHALDSPPSLSMHEEIDAVPARATMGILNNLVMFDQHVKQNSLQSIVPDLATGWSWSEDGMQLTFPLREGVKWHDGRPFTAKDVKCTWGPAPRQVERQAACQSTQIVVPQPYRGDDERRLRGHLPSGAAAAGICDASGFWLPAIPWSIHAMWRRLRCGSIRSARARSNSSSDSNPRTSPLDWNCVPRG